MRAMQMLKLFSIVLGGRADGCTVELHDVVFSVGKTLEETFPKLEKKWFGNKKRFHIDSTVELTSVDGYEIVIKKEKPNQENKLFFVNFGAYKENHFGELHEIGFYVGKSKPEILARAKQNLCLSLIDPHCDDNCIVDDIISIDQVDQHYIHLIPSAEPSQLCIQSGYRPLDVV